MYLDPEAYYPIDASQDSIVAANLEHAKPARVYHMFRLIEGEDDFDRIVREYMD